MTAGRPGTSAPSRATAPTRVSKRKRENEASSQRQVAQKLHHCAAVSDSFAAAQRAVSHQLLRYKTQKSRADELGLLQLAMEQTSQFLTHFSSEEVNSYQNSQVMSLRKRTDKMLTKVSTKRKSAALRTQKVVKRLPRLMKKATFIISEHRQVMKEKEELPARHQWVPMILWKIYDDVVETAEKEDEKKPLKIAMHQVMKTMREMNPFFYLQVLYQPPPEHLDGKWEIEASEKLTAIAASMTPYVRDLKKRSIALRHKRNASEKIRFGWNHLRVTLAFVRRAARHFHFLILHLYAVAMRCDAPNMHAGIISEKAASGILRSDAELRSKLRLSRDSATAEDNLRRETYEWTPELLVYLDEWRRQRDNAQIMFGFDRREQHQEFLPRFTTEKRSTRRIPRRDVLTEIGFHLRDVSRTWRASRLGTSHFEVMTIEDIGALEKKIKGNLGAVVDLIYKMMLARWMDRKKRSAEWWSSLELLERQPSNSDRNLQIDIPDNFLAEYAEDIETEVTIDPVPDTAEVNDDLQDVTDAESIELKEIERTRTLLPVKSGFRLPSKLSLSKVVANAAAATSPNRNVETTGHNTEQLSAARAAILGLYDRLKSSKSSLETTDRTETLPSCGNENDWSVTCLASRLRALTNRAVVFAEKEEMNFAAASFTKARKKTEEHATGQEESSDTSTSASEDDPTVEELQESVRNANRHLAALLSPYNGKHSPEWRDTILSTGLATVQLLRMISLDDGVRQIL